MVGRTDGTDIVADGGRLRGGDEIFRLVAADDRKGAFTLLAFAVSAGLPFDRLHLVLGIALLFFFFLFLHCHHHLLRSMPHFRLIATVIGEVEDGFVFVILLGGLIIGTGSLHLGGKAAHGLVRVIYPDVGKPRLG